MKIVEVNKEIATKIYEEVDRFIHTGKVRRIDAIVSLSALIINQCLDAGMPKCILLDKISQIWDEIERQEEIEE